MPEQGEICHEAGRVDIGDGSDGHPSAELVEIERSRNELPQFIPIKRCSAKRCVSDKDDDGDGREKEKVRTGADRSAKVDDGLFRDYFFRRSRHGLLDQPTTRLRLQLDFTERGFILRHILLQDIQKSLRLLRADVDALEILDADPVRRGLIHDAEEQKKIPEVNPDLHAVRVALTVVRGSLQLDIRRWLVHRPPW